MERRQTLATEELIEETVPPEEIIVSVEAEDHSIPDLRCAVCGVSQGEADDLPVGYSNPVCSRCDQLAVNEDGDDPWTGFPPGNEPEYSTDEPIQLAPDAGENPVYIAGTKCWRRYRFGGHITRRDAFDCASIEEFHRLHRVQDRWTHAFNTPQPDGVTIPDTGQLLDRLAALREVRAHAEQLLDEGVSADDAKSLERELVKVDSSLVRELFTPERFEPREYAESILTGTEFLAASGARWTSAPQWVKLAAFCERYVEG
ncbi:hypothetical protein [Halobaculum rarum]|uniref:hypothetical protein n=1 Tax=Halobaculum rarum TaxID=3075122 RepID=UPI0032AF1DCE